MKKAFAFSAFIFLLLGFTSCSDNSSTSSSEKVDSSLNSTSSPSSSSSEVKPTINIDLKDYVANIQDANSLRIKKSSKVNNQAKRAGNIENEGNQYLVKTVTSYESGDISVTEKEVEVTFKKIDVTSSTEIVEGEESYIPFEDGLKDEDEFIYSISFISYQGFSYALYDSDNVLLQGNITDNSDLDQDENNGVIKLSGLEKDSTYVVKYSGHGEETTITQESLVGAVIDKLYVYSPRFTFISFVPEGTSGRPDDDALSLDVDGVPLYDKKDYFSDDSRQSFILDNNTGFVYQIKDTNIQKIEKRVLYIKNSQEAYGFRVNGENELEIFKIVRNSTIRCLDVFGDKYNHYYVKNADLEGKDQQTNALFYKESDYYMFSQDGIALKLNIQNTIYPGITNVAILKTTKINSSFEETDIKDSESFVINTPLVYTSDTSEKGKETDFIVTKIQGGFIYVVDYSKAVYSRSTVSGDLISTYSNTAYYTFNWQDKIATSYGAVINDNVCVIYSNALPEMDPDLWCAKKADYYSLYFVYVWELEDSGSGATACMADYSADDRIEQLNARNLLLADCLHSSGDWVKQNLRAPSYQDLTLKKVSFDGTVFYKFVMDNGYPEIVNSETYVAPQNEVIVLQPIKR